MQPIRSYFDQITLEDLHEAIASERGRGPLGKQAAFSVGIGRSIAIMLEDGRSWRFKATANGIEIDEEINKAKLVIKTDAHAWQDLATEAWSIMGLILQSRITVEQGNFNHVAAWEAPLQALYNKRPIFTSKDIQSNYPHEFKQGDNSRDMKRSLTNLGFIVVREVFTKEEINEMSREVESRRSAATPEDKRSWWATDKTKNEHCCRVTYMNHGSKRFTKLASDPRLAALVDLSDEKLFPTPDQGDGISAVIKVPEITEGLADLPWHRDCGMGGHPLICPGLNIGIQLDEANEKSGNLIFLPGSNQFSGGIDVAQSTDKAISVLAHPGDVTVHYGHTLHIAPPPTESGLNRRTIYVSFHKSSYLEALPKGKGYNDVLFSHGDGRVRAPGQRF